MRLFDTLQYWSIRTQVGPHIDIADGGDTGIHWGGVLSGALTVIGVIVLFVLVFAGLRWLKANRGAAPTPSVGLDKASRARIQKALDSNDFDSAGEILLKAGQIDEAAEVFAQGRVFAKAARAYQQTGNVAQAIHYFKQAGDVRQAARLYADQGQHMAAAAEYFTASEFGLSAEQYELAGDFKRAAELHEKAKSWLRAGKLYEKAGDRVRAAENYINHFQDALSRASGDLEAVANEREVARRAGDILKEAGDLHRASQIFQEGGFFEEAAACLRSTGDLTKAAQLLLKAQQPLKAAQVLEEAGEGVQAAKMRAEAALRDRDFETAAKMFATAGDFEKAAKLYERLEDFPNAAELFEKLGDLNKALEYYIKADKPGHAAQCAEVIGRLDDAVEMFRKAGDIDGEIRVLQAQGDYFRAGRLQFEHRRYGDSLNTLSNIDSRDPIYHRALELQGDVLRSQGRFEKAYSKYRAAVSDRECSTGTLPLYYKMARVLEEEQDRNGALEHYNSILAVDRNYEDVSLRVKALLGRGRRTTIPGTTSSGIFAAPEGENGRRYEVIEEIARGGMGIVYQARDTVLGRIVAFKILGENLRDNETAVKYFLREARAAAALSHPNIVTIFDAGEQDGEYYMAMEFVEGTTLKELIKRKGALAEDQVRYILIHCCKALQYAHSKGVIHRDIKSGNVMITRDKALKIMDFGLAKFMKEYQKDHTQQVGTPFYMSPEQVIGKHIDFRSDLYSLGCTIFECATGTVPFFKGDLSYHHVHTKPPSPRSINPALSRDLERVILKMLEKDPNDRYQSAKDIIEDAVTD
ncbi:MAG: protein kinase [bacterium]